MIDDVINAVRAAKLKISGWRKKKGWKKATESVKRKRNSKRKTDTSKAGGYNETAAERKARYDAAFKK